MQNNFVNQRMLFHHSFSSSTISRSFLSAFNNISQYISQLSISYLMLIPYVHTLSYETCLLFCCHDIGGLYEPHHWLLFISMSFLNDHRNIFIMTFSACIDLSIQLSKLRINHNTIISCTSDYHGIIRMLLYHDRIK